MEPTTFTWRGTVRPAGLMTSRQRRRTPHSRARQYRVGASERTYHRVSAAAWALGITQQRFLDLIFRNWSPA